ncbi:MAG TPA: Crp/Fnr family transcriptional regulator [Ohtaekwangia sp.]
MNHLIQVMAAVRPVSPGLYKALEREVVALTLPKDYILLKAPQVADQVIFIDNGFAMAYSFYKGKRQVDNFWGQGELILSPQSFFERLPSAEFIKLTEQSDVLCISHRGLEKLLTHFPVTNHFFRVIMNRYYAQERERVRDLQRHPTWTQFQKLIRRFPDIEQRVPQEYIASYLGIAPQSLSRIKGQHG